LIVIAASNLSLCNYRLGNYQKAKEQAEQATSRWLARGDKPTADVLRAILQGGLGAALADQRDAAERAATLASTLVASIEHPWAKQLVLLMLADLLWLVGRRRDAIRAARRAIDLDDSPCTNQATGIFSRWSAIIAAKGRDPYLTLERLKAIEAQTENMDTIDVVELKCAIQYLSETMGQWDASRSEYIRQALARLPIPISHQLTRLGILTCSGMSKSFPKTSLRA
jgi:tetratricopeptide (TPR) repeat protein